MSNFPDQSGELSIFGSGSDEDANSNGVPGGSWKSSDLRDLCKSADSDTYNSTKARKLYACC